MAHLGADVAAFVDGQLSDASMDAARRHLQGCQDCRRDVQQQVDLKARMSGVGGPPPPADLLASLSVLPFAEITHESRWSRVVRSRRARIGSALMGVSVVFVVTAYVVGGGVRHGDGDPVLPAYDAYAAAFFGSTTAVTATNAISTRKLDDLTEYGWPCHAVLAGDLRRTGGSWGDHQEVISVRYANATSRLTLFEQDGSLDLTRLSGFTERQVGASTVWVREGTPTVVTWDADGTVFTIVTDTDPSRLAAAVQELPREDRTSGGTVSRIGHGVDRMTSWMGAA